MVTSKVGERGKFVTDVVEGVANGVGDFCFVCDAEEVVTVGVLGVVMDGEPQFALEKDAEEVRGETMGFDLSGEAV